MRECWRSELESPEGSNIHQNWETSMLAFASPFKKLCQSIKEFSIRARDRGPRGV